MNEKQSQVAAIFDMDGVLVDSVRLNWQAMNEVLVPYNVQVTDEEIKKYLGRTLKDQVGMLNVDYGLQLDYNQFNAATQQIKTQLFASIAPKDGVKELLQGLQQDGTPMAVATSMPRDLTEQRLRAAGILDYFDALVTEDDVERHKPDPEVFVKAAEKLGVAASSCVVFEDAPSGVTAAKAAEMKCVAVRTQYVEADHLKDADVRVATLAEITPSQLRELAAA